MTQHEKVNLKLSNTQLDTLKSVIKNQTGARVRISKIIKLGCFLRAF